MRRGSFRSRISCRKLKLNCKCFKQQAASTLALSPITSNKQSCCCSLLDTIGQKNLVRSTTGMSGKDSHVSTVRTSRTTWLPRHSSPIMDAIIKRGADVLKIDEALMRHRLDDEYPDLPNSLPINEDLQIVHYNKGQVRWLFAIIIFLSSILIQMLTSSCSSLKIAAIYRSPRFWIP